LRCVGGIIVFECRGVIPRIVRLGIGRISAGVGRPFLRVREKSTGGHRRIYRLAIASSESRRFSAPAEPSTMERNKNIAGRMHFI
jgi:hypothetical protein